jgi:hypothetical protein
MIGSRLSAFQWAGGEYDPDAFDPNAIVFDSRRKRWKCAFERSADAYQSISVAPDVRLDSVPPPLGVRLRPRSVLRAAMPKAATDENGYPRAHECQIRPSARAWKRPIDAEPETDCLDRRAHRELARSIATWGDLHSPTNLGGGRSREASSSGGGSSVSLAASSAHSNSEAFRLRAEEIPLSLPSPLISTSRQRAAV